MYLNPSGKSCSVRGFLSFLGIIFIIIILSIIYSSTNSVDEVQQQEEEFLQRRYNVTCLADNTKNIEAKIYNNVTLYNDYINSLITKDNRSIILPEDYAKEHCIYEEVLQK